MTLFLSAAAAAAPATTATPDETYLIWGFLLLAVAILLIVVELFVPSGGIIGLVAGVALIGSVVSFFTYDSTWGLAMALAYLLLGPIALVFGFKAWMASPLGRKLVLGGEEDVETDAESAGRASEQAHRSRTHELDAYIGRTGTTVTPLRPVGTVRIDDRRMDAMAEHGIIDAGVEVEVVNAYDNQLKVRPVA